MSREIDLDSLDQPWPYLTPLQNQTVRALIQRLREAEGVNRGIGDLLANEVVQKVTATNVKLSSRLVQLERVRDAAAEALDLWPPFFHEPSDLRAALNAADEQKNT